MVNIGRFSSSRIFLIGYMASGKSTIGRSLAAALNFDFLDTDQAIAKLKGESVEELFRTKGESYFRQEEHKILNLTSSLDKIIIATGGGMPIHNDNMQTMLFSGLTIFLETEIEVLEGRLRQTSIRPLHQSSKNLPSEIAERYNKRYPQYREAHLVITNNGTVDETTQLILQKLNRVNQIGPLKSSED